MQVISPCMPTAERLTFPHIRAMFLLIETHSAATAFFTRWKMAGQDFETSLSPPMPPSLPWQKVAVKLISSFRDPGAKPAKTLHFMRASKG